ncbi:MAG: redox-sensing transcriptional repressor Rex [Chloroflexi bacterium]|nr:redox-sensing transcriptional repressor Rex [Chloroflexota bacterium]
MGNEKAVPYIVVSRLPVYLRALEHFARSGKTITSSQELAEHLGTTSAQIRKDLSYFGEFGKQGTGYAVQHLVVQLRRILKVESQWDVVLVGAGDLGHALTHYNGFAPAGFRITAVYDNDERKVGQLMAGLEIRDSRRLRSEAARCGFRVGILAVPASGAQEVANELIAGGVRAILNYAPITLAVPDGVRVEYVDPVVYLQRMTFYVQPD